MWPGVGLVGRVSMERTGRKEGAGVCPWDTKAKGLKGERGVYIVSEGWEDRGEIVQLITRKELGTGRRGVDRGGSKGSLGMRGQKSG